MIDSPAAVDLTEIGGIGTVTGFLLTERATATTGLTLMAGEDEITDPANRAAKRYTTDSERQVWYGTDLVSAPKAADGLVYNGYQQTGVSPGTGYSVVDNKGTKPGTYTATAMLGNGSDCWSDGTTGHKTVAWVIARAVLTATYPGETVVFGTSPGLRIDVTGFVGDDDPLIAEGYTAPAIGSAETDVGMYLLIPTGGEADCYDFMYIPGTLTIIGADVPDDGAEDVPDADLTLLYAGVIITAAAIITVAWLIISRKRKSS
ncbi:MAG: hypothetical protein GX137_07090, partial [Thermoplasmatales archaeon]|nr:hypothetical protein [Thermoplasmatales archaeon]